jgi:hypothetical protein
MERGKESCPSRNLQQQLIRRVLQLQQQMLQLTRATAGQVKQQQTKMLRRMKRQH